MRVGIVAGPFLALCTLAGCASSIRSAATSANPSARAALVARIDSLIGAFLSTTPASSAAVAVVQGADTIVMRGYGLSDRAAGRLATPNTVYQIASITKQITAAAIMRLVDQGKLRLEDDVSKHLPAVSLHGRRVTVRQLVNHTSGIPNFTSKPGWRALWAEDLTPDRLVGLVARDSFDFEPGARYSYNNTGYTMLGMIIERVSGKPYWQFFADEFFTPLGLTRTRYCPPPAERDSTFAVGYSVTNNTFEPAQYISRTHPNAAGAVCSTVREYLVWQRALHEGRNVSPQSYQLMITPDTLNNGLPMTYGLGLFAETLGPRRMITHSGSISGFTTAQLYFPAESLSVVIFTNTDMRGPEPTALNVARAVFGMPLVPRVPRPPAVALAPADRDRLLGQYDLVRPDGRLLPLRIFLTGETLIAEAEGIGPRATPLVHYGSDTFASTLDPTLRLTFTRENGAVTGVRIVHWGTTFAGRRRP
jgi:CubicO group peptidase (beta-lactamase class C family)